MNVDKIKRIQAMYRQTKRHSDIKEAFGINDAECVAINSFGLRHGLSAKFLATHMDNVKDGMTVDEIAVALGFSSEDVLVK